LLGIHSNDAIKFSQHQGTEPFNNHRNMYHLSPQGIRALLVIPVEQGQYLRMGTRYGDLQIEWTRDVL